MNDSLENPVINHTIESLQAGLRDKEIQLRQSHADHEDALDVISDYLLSCMDPADYDDMVTDLERKNVNLKARERPFDVRIRVTYETTVTVNATDDYNAAEEAERIAWENPAHALVLDEVLEVDTREATVAYV